MKLLPFRKKKEPEFRVETFAERLQRVKDSLEKINNLMEELKNKSPKN